MYTVAQAIKEEKEGETLDAKKIPSGISKVVDRFGHRFLLANAGDLWLPCLSIGQSNDFQSQLRNVKGFHIRDKDILICSYPKSGLHWHLEIVTMLLNKSLDYMSREAFTSSYLEMSGTESASDVPEGKPRVLHTHLPFRYIPRQVLGKKTKVIHLVRNPKDVMTSLYCQTRHVKRPFDYAGTFEQFVYFVLECGFAYGCVFEHLMGFQSGWEEHPDVPVYTSVFEDMKKDPVEGTKRLNHFLDTGCSEEMCRQVAEACEFHRLKSHRKTHLDTLEELVFQNEKGGFFRKGDVGDWKNWFTDQLSKDFDEQCRQRMQGYKIAFQYEETQSTK